MLHSIAWWAFLQLLAVAALPWAFVLFRSLPDRGYGLAKVLGLLLVVYAYWAIVMARFLPNSGPSLLIVLIFYLAASAFLAWRLRDEILLFFRYNRRLLVVEEGVFSGAFFLFVAFRMLAPDVHLTTALTVTTEQPMDLAFLAGLLRSPTFPPADPWLAGHPISYYYFGYLAFGLPARLAMTAPTTAYSLALAAVFALAASAAFSVVANAVALGNFGRRGVGRVGGLAIFAGLAAAAFSLVAGNLVAVGHVIRRFGAIGEVGLLGDPNWWWGPSRVIVDGTNADPIDEFPAFSFVLGDLHPHVMALPFALLALGVALSWLTRPQAPDAKWPAREPGEMALIALIIGALGFANTWDLPTYLGVFLGALVIRRLWQSSESLKGTLLDIVVPALAITVLTLLLYSPFYVQVNGQSQGVLPVVRTGTKFVHYLLIWGPLLAAAATPVVAAAFVRTGERVVSGKVMLVMLFSAIVPLILWTAARLLWQANPQDSPPTLSEIASRWALLGPAVALLYLALVAVVPSPWAEEAPSGRTFLYLVVGAAALAVIVPEIFFVRDLFGTRMNTVFKLHYQAWLLFSVAAGIGLAWLLAQARPRAQWQRLASGAGFAVVVVVALLALGYGVIAVATRVRHSPSTSSSLDGLALYRRLYPDETAAIEWLRREAPTGATVLEAVGGDYSDYARVSAITGVRTVLGWEGHELQWRSGFELFASRRGDVATIYQGGDQERVLQLLRLYDVDYVFIGRMEREAYGPDVAARMEQVLPGAQSWKWGDVMVIRVPPE